MKFLVKYRNFIHLLQSPVTSLTWGHNDKRIFVATGKVSRVNSIEWS